MNIIPRTDWKARAPRSRHWLGIPTPGLWLHHSADAASGPSGVRAIQNFHMDTRGYDDIAYSFLIDRDTLDVYTGRGAGVVGQHTRNHNTRSHAICVMGNFQGVHRPSAALLERIAALVAYGHGQGWWPATITGGHRDVSNTACPGQNLYAQIPTINRLARKDPPMADPYVLPANRRGAIEEIQRVLVDAGYDLGTFGADRNGVDGDPGPATTYNPFVQSRTVAAVHALKNERNDLKGRVLDLKGRVLDLEATVDRLLAELDQRPDVHLANVGRLAVELHTTITGETS